MHLSRFFLALPVLAALSGCPTSQPDGFPYAGGFPSPTPSGNALSDLIQNTASSDIDVAGNLAAPLTLNFPVRLGILFFDYQPAMTPEDMQNALDAFRKALPANLVRSSVVLPSTLVSSSASLEDVRNLVARFSIDTVLIISGSNALSRAAQQPNGFFAQFSTAANFQASCELEGLVLNVLSDRFLPPLTAAGSAGPTLLDPNDPSFAAGSYTQAQQAETQALTNLQSQLLRALQSVPSAPPSSPTPTASPTPSPQPT